MGSVIELLSGHHPEVCPLRTSSASGIERPQTVSRELSLSAERCAQFRGAVPVLPSKWSRTASFPGVVSWWGA
jgi:hypothetical protein